MTFGNKMSLSDFLKDLPTYNRENFTKISSESATASRQANSRTRPAMYVPTKDHPEEQEIVTERTNILLRYLHQQLDKKIAISAAQKKREADSPSKGNSEVARKKARLDPLPNGSNVSMASASAASASDPNVPSSSAPSSSSFRD